MKNIVFLPQWYIEKKLESFRYRSKVCLVLLLCINIVLCCLGLSNSYNSYEINLKKLRLESANTELQKNKMDNKKELNDLKTMNYFIGDFAGKINFSNVIIEDKKISFETELEGKNSYYEIIKYIEDKKIYRIINIYQIEKKAEKTRIELSLEVMK